MGRAERRRAERRNRIEGRKGKVLMSRQEISQMKEKVSNDTSEFNVEALMTCFALAERKTHKFGKERILRTLYAVDEMMGPLIDGTATIDDYKQILKDEIGLSITCN